MSGQSWSIMITASGFVVDAFGQSGSALNAQNGDVISWNNQTDQVHQPYQTDSSYNPTGPQLSDPIPAWKSSSPGYIPDTDTTPTTIYYYCKNHTNEHGTINVVA
jgi:hypothetical protein